MRNNDVRPVRTQWGKWSSAFVAALALAVSALPQAHAAGEEYFPLQSYRVGPYAAGGSGFFGGSFDEAVTKAGEDIVKFTVQNFGSR